MSGYNDRDPNRPPNYCGVDFGRDCCPECGGEVYQENEGWGEDWYYEYDVPNCKNSKPKNRFS